MSVPAMLFFAYFGVGLLLMTIAVATPGKEKRTKWWGGIAFITGDGFDAGLLIFIALLWPIWLIVILAKRSRRK